MNTDTHELTVIDGNNGVIEYSPLDMPVAEFSAALNRRESNRQALLKWIAESLVDGTDYGRIHIAKNCRDKYNCNNPRHFSKPSLWKPGAEKICGMLGLIPRFPHHAEYERAAYEGREIFQIIIRCELHTASGFIAGEGLGGRSLAKDKGDINKALKMSEKSAHVDATLRVGGLSEIFTQDIEDMGLGNSTPQQPPAPQQPSATVTQPVTHEFMSDGQVEEIIRLVESEFFGIPEQEKAREWLIGSHSAEHAAKFINRLNEIIEERRPAMKKMNGLLRQAERVRERIRKDGEPLDYYGKSIIHEREIGKAHRLEEVAAKTDPRPKPEPPPKQPKNHDDELRKLWASEFRNWENWGNGKNFEAGKLAWQDFQEAYNLAEPTHWSHYKHMLVKFAGWSVDRYCYVCRKCLLQQLAVPPEHVHHARWVINPEIPEDSLCPKCAEIPN